MRDDSYAVLNTGSFLFHGFVGLLTVGCGYSAFENSSALAWVWAIFAGCICLSGILFSPVYCALSPEGIKIVYLFGCCEYAPWDEITAIEYKVSRKTKGRNQHTTRSFIFKTLQKNRNAFFMRSTFPGSNRLYDLLWYFAKDKMTEVYYINGKKE